MGTETLKAMVGRLQELADGAAPGMKWCGICEGIRTKFGENAYQKIKSLLVIWPEFSGDDIYPVSHVDGAMLAYLNYAKWSGEYGAARRRLCGFLAQKIREEIGDETN